MFATGFPSRLIALKASIAACSSHLVAVRSRVAPDFERCPLLMPVITGCDEDDAHTTDARPLKHRLIGVDVQTGYVPASAFHAKPALSAPAAVRGDPTRERRVVQRSGTTSVETTRPRIRTLTNSLLIVSFRGG